VEEASSPELSTNRLEEAVHAIAGVGLVLLSLVSASVLPAAAGAAAPPRVVQLLVGDNMKFDPATISASPGESIKVVLKGVGTMPKVAMGHNFVLLKKASDAKGVVDKSASARDTDFIAPAVQPQLLAFTKLVGPGETVDVTFTAPAQRGDYLFICTFPGHFAMGMKGTLTVK
jgi:azurin